MKRTMAITAIGLMACTGGVHAQSIEPTGSGPAGNMVMPAGGGVYSNPYDGISTFGSAAQIFEPTLSAYDIWLGDDFLTNQAFTIDAISSVGFCGNGCVDPFQVTNFYSMILDGLPNDPVSNVVLESVDFAFNGIDTWSAQYGGQQLPAGLWYYIMATENSFTLNGQTYFFQQTQNGNDELDNNGFQWNPKGAFKFPDNLQYITQADGVTPSAPNTVIAGEPAVTPFLQTQQEEYDAGVAPRGIACCDPYLIVCDTGLGIDSNQRSVRLISDKNAQINKKEPFHYDTEPDAVYVFNTTSLPPTVVNTITSVVDKNGEEHEIHGARLVDVAFNPKRAYVTLGAGTTGGQGACAAVMVVDMEPASDTFAEAIDLIPLVFCPADCNNDGTLNILDFVCFQTEWQNQSPLGDCDNNGAYNILDFVCYQGLFQAGCDISCGVDARGVRSFQSDGKDLVLVTGHFSDDLWVIDAQSNTVVNRIDLRACIGTDEAVLPWDLDIMTNGDPLMPTPMAVVTSWGLGNCDATEASLLLVDLAPAVPGESECIRLLFDFPSASNSGGPWGASASPPPVNQPGVFGNQIVITSDGVEQIVRLTVIDNPFKFVDMMMNPLGAFVVETINVGDDPWAAASTQFNDVPIYVVANGLSDDVTAIGPGRDNTSTDLAFNGMADDSNPMCPGFDAVGPNPRSGFHQEPWGICVMDYLGDTKAVWWTNMNTGKLNWAKLIVK